MRCFECQLKELWSKISLFDVLLSLSAEGVAVKDETVVLLCKLKGLRSKTRLLCCFVM